MTMSMQTFSATTYRDDNFDVDDFDDDFDDNSMTIQIIQKRISDQTGNRQFWTLGPKWPSNGFLSTYVLHIYS